MEGILISLASDKMSGRVDTRNDNIGVLTIYFQNPDHELKLQSTISFNIVTSRIGNKYAKFISIVDRNKMIFNTENRDLWYAWGENFEDDFIEKIVPRLDVDIRKNPNKKTRPWEIDLVDYTHNLPADLKTQNTPFFTVAKKYKYGKNSYDPSYAVTFNRKDYDYYKKNYPNCDIYFWIHWTQLELYGIKVQPVYGVWKAHFSKMAELIENNVVALHPYMHRTTDDHNAKDSFVFDLRDSSVFQKLI